ncbi:MAG: hypothetical protein IJE43_10985 [Alphaproteobacteria bacterium]|nr:hypothetical protein [Alphaproteobacteria bacterium]
MPEKSTQEKITYLSKQEQQTAAFEALKGALQLINLEKNRNITSSTYSRENLRTYLQAPSTETNQKSLRKLSDFLYNISQTYKRMIKYKAEQITCKSWVAYPVVSLVEENDEEQIKQNYEDVCRIVTNMHMETQILKLMIRAWKHDVVYGYVYGDPSTDEGFYIHPLDPDYCRIYGADFHSGVLHVAYDMSYFRTYQDDLEYFDKEFQTLYKQYERDNIKWKELPIEKAFAWKINIDNLEYPIVPFSGLLEEIINLEDLEAVQNVVDELGAYKLIWAKIPTISGTKDADDFAIDLNLANEFYKKLLGIIPDGVNLAMSPMDLDTIDFNKNAAAEDTNTLNKAYQNLIETNGSIVLNSNRITNSESFKKAMMVECLDAMKPTEQINAWLNLYLKLNHGIENFIVEFSNVSPYFIEDRIKTIKEAGQYGLPVKLEYASLLNETPMKERGMSFLENMLGLGVTDWIKPLVSSNTQAGFGENGDGSEGAPEKDSTDISADGVATRDKK